jgi:hypothetical protein
VPVAEGGTPDPDEQARIEAEERAAAAAEQGGLPFGGSK